MEDQDIWDLFFLNVCGWQEHPGRLRDRNSYSLDNCADIADEMMLIRQERKGKWRGDVVFKVYGPDGQLKENC